MINFNKNKLINETLDKYYETFSHTLDTVDYVPDAYNKKICKYIFKNMRRAFKCIDKDDRQFQRALNRKNRLKLKEKKQQERLAKPKKVKFAKLKKLFSKFRQRTNKNADSNNG